MPVDLSTPAAVGNFFRDAIASFQSGFEVGSSSNVYEAYTNILNL